MYEYYNIHTENLSDHWDTKAIEEYIDSTGLFRKQEVCGGYSAREFNFDLQLMYVQSKDSWSSENYNSEKTNYIAIVVSDKIYKPKYTEMRIKAELFLAGLADMLDCKICEEGGTRMENEFENENEYNFEGNEDSDEEEFENYEESEDGEELEEDEYSENEEEYDEEEYSEDEEEYDDEEYSEDEEEYDEEEYSEDEEEYDEEEYSEDEEELDEDEYSEDEEELDEDEYSEDEEEYDEDSEDEEELDEDEYSEDEENIGNSSEPSNRLGLFIDGMLTNHKFTQRIREIAEENGSLEFVKLYHLSSDKRWKDFGKQFSVHTEQIIVSADNKNAIMKDSMLKMCDSIDIFCISTNAGYFGDVVNQLKMKGKKVVLVSTWATMASKLKKACDVLFVLNESVEKNTEPKTPAAASKKKPKAAAAVPQKTQGVVFIDGTKTSHKYARSVMQEAESRGEVAGAYVFTVKGVNKSKKWKKTAREFGIDEVDFDSSAKLSHVYSVLTKQMMIQANDKKFIVFAGDNKYFADNLKRLRNSGKNVVIAGTDSIPEKMVKSCDIILDLRNDKLYACDDYLCKKYSYDTALFIDGENISHEYANKILSKAWEQGNINLDIGGVYCRESDQATKQWKLKAKAFKLTINKIKGKAAKNKVDNAIISDMMKCMKNHEDIKTFCIATHDKDYKKAVIKLRKAGKRVCVIGHMDTVSDDMRFTCNEFVEI